MHRLLPRVAMAAGVVVFALSSLQCEQVLGLDQLYDCPQDPRCPQPDGGTGGSGPASTCSDGKKSGDETGTDCGGSCGPCPAGEGCKGGKDCASKLCSSGGTCAAAACDDTVQNQDETDVDCGGATCGPCGFGKGCSKGGDCVTGFCNGTTCDAKTIVGGLTNPNSLAADDWGVFWADGDDGTIMQADFATGTPAQLTSGRSGPQGIVIQPMGAGAPSELYWVEPSAGNVMGTSTQSLPAVVWSPAAGQTSPSALAVAADQTYPFWTATGGVWTYGFTAQTVTTFTGSGGPIAVAPLAAGCDVLVYATTESGGWLQALAQPANCQNGLGTLASGYAIAGVAVDAANAYWTDGAMAGTVSKRSLTGFNQPAVIAPNQAHPTDIAVDAASVYWLNQGAAAGMGAVMKAPIGGGPLTVLASGQDTPRGLFITESAVYWISGAKGQGAIKKLPK